MNGNVFEKVEKIIKNELHINKDVALESELVNDLGINSIQRADLILSCEDEFDIEIDDKQISKFKTVGDLVAHIEKTVEA